MSYNQNSVLDLPLSKIDWVELHPCFSYNSPRTPLSLINLLIINNILNVLRLELKRTFCKNDEKVYSIQVKVNIFRKR